MKKISMTIVATVSLLSLAACGGTIQRAEPTPEPEPQIEVAWDVYSDLLDYGSGELFKIDLDTIAHAHLCHDLYEIYDLIKDAGDSFAVATGGAHDGSDVLAYIDGQDCDS